MSKVDYLTVRYEGDDDDDYYSNSDPQKEQEQDDIIKEDQPIARAAPNKTPTPSPKTPESIHNSQVTLNVTSDGEIRKLRLQKTNVISIVNDLIYLLENSANNSDTNFLIKRRNHSSEEVQSKIKPSYAFHLHSLVLSARSEFCRKILEKREDTKGKFERIGIRYNYTFDHSEKKHMFELEGIHVDVFQEFVKFLYIAQCKVNLSNHIGLIQLARVFKIRCLEDLICKFVLQRLEKFDLKAKGFQLNELIDLTRVSYEFNLSETIRSKCIDLLTKSRGEIIQTEAWDAFASAYPRIVSDMLAR